MAIYNQIVITIYIKKKIILEMSSILSVELL